MATYTRAGVKMEWLVDSEQHTLVKPNICGMQCTQILKTALARHENINNFDLQLGKRASLKS